MGVSGQHYQLASAKAQTRNPKSEGRKKAETRNPKCPSVASAFGIRPSFGFRPSEFGFGRLAAGGGTVQIRPGCIKLHSEGPAGRGGDSLSPARWVWNYGDRLSPPLNAELDATLLPVQGWIKLPDREPSRLAAGDNGLGCWTFWRLFALVAAASRDGSRSEPELDATLLPVHRTHFPLERRPATDITRGGQ
jgi:hypothetical protein